jgi:acyl-coenzyme A synthetase/AMP-(fatty) acid ligase
LRDQTNRFANALGRLGVGKGDRVYALMGRVPELYVTDLGALKNRSVFCPLFSAFGPEPIKARINNRTYRFRAHSMYDAELYRSKDEVEQWKKQCPIITFIERLRTSELLTGVNLDAIESTIAKEIYEAIAFAEAGAWEPVEDLLKDVYTTSNLISEA